MATFRNKSYFLWISILIVFGVALMQVLNSSIGLIVFLSAFGGLAVFSAMKDMAVPVLLFFLPWSPLLKLQPGMISVYSIALITVMIVYVFRNSKSFSFGHVIPAALLFVQTIIIKTLKDDPIDNGYVLFFACLILFPIIASEKDKEYDFYTLVMFFSVGIIGAALSAQQLMVFPTISRYITVHEYSSLTRLSGFYGDPNFYSAHIAAAISCVLVLLLNEVKLSRKIILYISLIVLFYAGFLSVSKSFTLIIICVALLWIVEVLFRRGKISGKLMMLLALAIGGVFVLSSVLFTDLIDMILDRFLGGNDTLSDFTTGRTELWISYLRAFEDNPWMMVFGEGFTEKLINGRGSHNVLIQSIYQFGIVGTVFLTVWVLSYFKSLLRSARLYSNNIVQTLVLATGTFGPWLGIDPIMFDEFFLLPFLASIGILYISRISESENSLEARI